MDESQYRSSVYNRKNGRYVFGGKTEVSAGFVEHWERTEPERDPSDVPYFLEAKYVGRIDLLAYIWYGDPGLEWVILWFNNILDPDEEMTAGKLLLMPVPAKVESLKSQAKTGGVSSTRT